MGEGLQRARGAAMQTQLPIKVRVGQVWQDTDSRITYVRRVKVIEIQGDRALCDTGCRKVKIRLDRFKPGSTGYKLVQDVD